MYKIFAVVILTLTLAFPVAAQEVKASTVTPDDMFDLYQNEGPRCDGVVRSVLVMAGDLTTGVTKFILPNGVTYFERYDSGVVVEYGSYRDSINSPDEVHPLGVSHLDWTDVLTIRDDFFDQNEYYPWGIRGAMELVPVCAS